MNAGLVIVFAVVVIAIVILIAVLRSRGAIRFKIRAGGVEGAFSGREPTPNGRVNVKDVHAGRDVDVRGSEIGGERITGGQDVRIAAEALQEKNTPPIVPD
jgi:hypothetical protein